MTANWTSTMGAPLNEAETAAILEAWQRLCDAAVSTTACPDPLDIPDPLEMLTYCNNVVMHVYEVRRAIDRGWAGANARRWPTPALAPKSRARPRRAETAEELLAELRALGATDAAILACFNKTK